MFKNQFSSPSFLRLPTAIGLLVATLACHPAGADTVRWQGPVDGLWTDPAKWDANRVPGRSDDVVIDVTGSSSYTVTLNSISAINSLTLGSGTGTTQQILTIADGFTNGASLSIIAGSTVRSNGVLNIQSTLTGTGSLAIAGRVNWKSGSLIGTGAVNVQTGGILDLSPVSGASSLTLSRAINNAGTVKWNLPSTGGSVIVQTSAPITNQTAGLFEFQGAGAFNGTIGNTAPPPFVNGGLLRKTGTGTLDFSGLQLVLAGPLDVLGGNVRALSGGSVPVSTGGNTVNINLAAGAQWIVAVAGYNFNGKADISGNGILKLAGGPINVAQDVNVDSVLLAGAVIDGNAKFNIKKSLSWTGGDMAGKGVVECSSSAICTISGNTSKSLNRNFDNFGLMTWSGSGNISSTSPMVWNNKLGSSFVVTGDAHFVASRESNSQFVNVGSMRKTGGSSTVFENMKITNTGAVECQAGDLSLGDQYVQNAGRTTLKGGSISARGVQGANAIMDLRGGMLTGTGVINANVLNGAKCRPGFSPGLMEVNGSYVQTANGSLDAEIAGLAPGTEFDQLSVSGDVTLAGKLNTSLLNAFAPPANSSFDVITFGGVLTGKFDSVGTPAAGPGQYFTVVNGLGFVAAATTADAVLPTGTISQPMEGRVYPDVTNATLATVAGTAADMASGVVSASITVARFPDAVSNVPNGFLLWSNSTFTSPQSAAHDKIATGTTNWTISLPSLATGFYGVRVTIKDYAGNSGFVPSGSTWRRFSVPALFTISGTVTNQSGVGVAGVVVTRGSGVVTPVHSTTSTVDGTFTLTNVPPGTHTLSASNGVAQTFVFNPATQSVTVGAANVSSVLFLALSTPAVSGRVTNSLGTGVTAVTVTRTGAAGTVAVTTNASGYYGFSSVTANSGNATLTPTKTNISFTPATIVVNVAAASSYANNNFTAKFSIKGNVTLNGAAKSGVTLNLKQNNAVLATTITDASGNYTFSSVAASATNYVVEPSLTGHTFAPATISVAVTVNARLSNNFTATAVGPIQVLRANLLTATVGDGTAPQVKLAFGIALGGGGGAFELFVNGTSTGFAQCEVDSSAGEIIWTLPSGSLRAGDVVSVKLHGFADEHGNALLESAGPVVAQ